MEKEKMDIRINEVIKVNMIIDKLLEQQTSFEIKTAYKLWKIKKELDEVESLLFERLKLLLGDNFNFELDKLDESQLTAYNMIMETSIEIEDNDLTIDELLADGVKLDYKDMEYLMKIAWVIKKDGK